MMFAQMYDCSKCGKVWKVEMVLEAADCDNEDFILVAICCKCNSPVKPLSGQLHALSEEEMEAEFICGDNHEYDPEYDR